MKKIIATIITIVMMVGLVAPYKATAAEATGNTVATLVNYMKENQDNPNVSGIACCSGVWVTYRCGRIVGHCYASESMGESGMFWCMSRSLSYVIGDPD